MKVYKFILILRKPCKKRPSHNHYFYQSKEMITRNSTLSPIFGLCCGLCDFTPYLHNKPKPLKMSSHSHDDDDDIGYENILYSFKIQKYREEMKKIRWAKGKISLRFCFRDRIMKRSNAPQPNMQAHFMDNFQGPLHSFTITILYHTLQTTTYY